MIAVAVDEVQADQRVLHIRLEAHSRGERSALAVGQHVGAAPVQILEPSLENLGAAVAVTNRFVDLLLMRLGRLLAGFGSTRLLGEVELQIAVADVFWIPEFDCLPMLEEQSAVAKSLHR